MQTPENGRQAPVEVDEVPVLRIAALGGGSAGAAVGDLLRGASRVAVAHAASTDELVGLALSGRADLVLFCPDAAVAWPVDAAEGLARELRRRTPLLVVCGAEHDGVLIERRVGGTDVTVLVQASLTPELLVDAIMGAVARHRASPGGRGS